METGIPSLSPEGWVKNKYDIIELGFKHFLASDQNQSNLFKDKVSSLKYIAAMYTTDEELRTGIIDGLESLFESYFDLVEIQVDIKDAGSYVKVFITGTLTDKTGKTYNLERNIGIKNNQILI